MCRGVFAEPVPSQDFEQLLNRDPGIHCDPSILVYLHDRLAIALDVTAIHSTGVKAEFYVAAGVQRDHAAFASLCAQSRMNRLIDRLRKRYLRVFHASSDIVGEQPAHEVFTDPGSGHGGRGIVGIDAGTDDRRVADPAEQFIGQPPG